MLGRKAPTAWLNGLMNKPLTAAAAALLAASAVPLVAPPAQAVGVLGTVKMSYSSVRMSWITVSKLSIPSYAGAVRIDPGGAETARHFISGWNCYSIWGFRYYAGRWWTMTTTGTLELTCKDH